MISLTEVQKTLAIESPEAIENLAQKAKRLTQQYFGHTISLYAPLYISNYCSSHCTYCGFHVRNRIHRLKLTPGQINKEMAHVAQSGIENILILTGESYQATPLAYLKEAVEIAQKYFSSISLEVHPMDETEYGELFAAGVDGIAIYQETYNRHRYAQVHLSGKKKNYDYRYGAPERIAHAGMRQISMGILLGLADDVAADAHELFLHLRFMEKNFPGVEYSLSFPRLRPIKGLGFEPCLVSDLMLFKIICLARIVFPRVGINLSTRESARLRDRLLGVGITRISAASKTSVGGYTSESPEDLDPQFDIQDERSVENIVAMLKKRNFDPVLTDWRRIDNKIFS